MKRDQNFIDCLYFSLNIFTRKINEMADNAFFSSGLSPSHAFAMMTVIDNPGIKPVELAARMVLAPSTITRFVDKLESKGLIRREPEGNSVKIFPTDKGNGLSEKLDACWSELHQRMLSDIGFDEYPKAVEMIYHFATKSKK